MSFLQPSDFIGIVSLSSNEFSDIQIQLYIDRYEPIYLTDLLGCEFYDEFIADLTPTPAAPTSVPTDAKLKHAQDYCKAIEELRTVQGFE